MNAVLQNPDSTCSASEPKSDPLLDTIETSGRFPLSYHDYLKNKDPSEFNASLEAYDALDQYSTSHRSKQLRECRNFAWFAINKESREVKVLANACRLRWCPICARAKSAAVAFSVGEFLKNIDRPKFLTLTLRHSVAPLAHQINSIYKAFRALRKTKLWRKKVKGGIWFFQIKKSSADKLWHPHIHCVLESGYIAQQALSELWFKISKSSFVVDIRTVYKKDKAADYIARYSARPSNLKDMPLDDRISLISSLHGRRLCGAFGSAKGVDLKGARPDDDGTWRRISTWSKTLKSSHAGELGSVLFRCWMLREPVPDHIDLTGLSNVLADGPSPLLEDLNLDDY